MPAHFLLWQGAEKQKALSRARGGIGFSVSQVCANRHPAKPFFLWFPLRAFLRSVLAAWPTAIRRKIKITLLQTETDSFGVGCKAALAKVAE
jgi:hypothetical protein